MSRNKKGVSAAVALQPKTRNSLQSMGCLISWLAVSDTQETSSRRSVVSLGYLDMSCIKWRDQLNGCALLCDPITNRSHNVIENSDKMTVFFFSRFNFLELIRTYSVSNDRVKYLLARKSRLEIKIPPNWKIFNYVNYYICPFTKMENVLSWKTLSNIDRWLSP